MFGKDIILNCFNPVSGTTCELLKTSQILISKLALCAGIHKSEVMLEKIRECLNLVKMISGTNLSSNIESCKESYHPRDCRP